MKVLSVVGARPNFMKVAPLHAEMSSRKGIESVIVHTGQHYDQKMSDVFFNQLGLPEPDHYLGIGGGTHADATAKVMMAFDKILTEEKPNVVLVVGDVNPTLACGLVAKKRHYPLVHVEAGLRSGDMKMPEEVNRRCVDVISDQLFVTEQSGLDNLLREGTEEEKIHFVGNVMIDSLMKFLPRVESTEINEILQRISRFPETLVPIQEGAFLLVTMHRPSNVDSLFGLTQITTMLEALSAKLPLVFAVHPRTYNAAITHGVLERWKAINSLILTHPVGYLEFIKLLATCKCVLTDSGGIQEETSFLGKPCFTFRSSTERPITVTKGTNILMSSLDPMLAIDLVTQALDKAEGPAPEIPFWDGRASARIVDVLVDTYGKPTEQVA